MADIKRKAARGIAVIAIALGAGQLAQSMTDRGAPQQPAKATLSHKPKHIETVAATAEVSPPSVAMATAQATLTLPSAPQPAQPEIVAESSCPVTFDLSSDENAMLRLTLVAPCHKNERVVLKHAGLAVTAKTTVTGALFSDLPALVTDATVEVLFADGSYASGSIAAPEMSSLRRFGVQWQADDAFQIHAFEGKAGYGEPGDISGENPHSPLAGVPASGGFLTRLGDASTDLPLLAEVYTYPADGRENPDVVVEAAVTPTACGREMLAETLATAGSRVEINELTVAMPECDAVGDYLVLKNLAPDLNIASSE